MRNFFLIGFVLWSLLHFSCKTKKQNFYHGFVYDMKDKKPLKSVFVRENLKVNFLTAKTDSSGYFKIVNKTESIGDLIFVCNGFKTDTIVTVWSQHGEKLKYFFLNKTPDTIFMKPIK